MNSRQRQKSGYRGKTKLKKLLSGIEKLCERYNRCIAVRGDYVEKQSSSVYCHFS